MQKNSEKFIFTIFGASGDLASLKLFPALFELYNDKRFGDEIFVIGYARSEISKEEFRDRFKNSVTKFCKKEDLHLDENLLSKMLENVHYFKGSYNDVDDFKKYAEFVKEIGCEKYEQELFHFSVPPKAYAGIIEMISEVRSGKDNEKVKLLIEKPFGSDLESAYELERVVKSLFCEDQIYMIDHYLGKTAIRSIASLRMHNRVLNMLFDGAQISNIQISAIESVNVEDRINYYDNTGALKDMFQSHLLQLLSIVMMDLPVELTSEAFASSKEDVINNLEVEEAVFGQYKGYCENNEYECSLDTDTFFALKMSMNKQRWQGVPVYIRSGKAMNRKQTSVVIEFKNYANQSQEKEHNRLIFEIDPKSSIKLSFIDLSGSGNSQNEIVTAEELDCGKERCLSSHATLFLDAISGKKDFFVTFNQALQSWKLTEKIIKDSQIVRYEKGSSEVGRSEEMLKLDGNKWFDIYE